MRCFERFVSTFQWRPGRIGSSIPVLLAALVVTFALSWSPVCSLAAFAAEDKDDIPLLNQEQEDALDRQQKEISETVVNAAIWLDSFFDDGRYTAEENETRGTLRLVSGYTEDDEFEFKPRLSLRMRFPNMMKRLNLIIQAADDEDFDVDGNPALPGDEDTDRGELEASLQYIFVDSLRQNISTSFGGSWNYLYAGLRYRYLKNWEKWDLRFTDRIRWYTDDGWENIASLDFERIISKRMMFRATTSATWAEEEEGVPHAELFRLYHVLSEHKALLYETGVYLDTEPEYEVIDVQLRVRYRQRFYRDWLVFEIAPELTFPDDENNDATPGIFFKLEASFGYESDTDTFKNIFRF